MAEQSESITLSKLFDKAQELALKLLKESETFGEAQVLAFLTWLYINDLIIEKGVERIVEMKKRPKEN